MSIGFAEPDWQGDADFTDNGLAPDLDAVVADLAVQIEDGVRFGWLDAYYARRAAFDLQSIRCQIAHERRATAQDIGRSDLRAILSRIDRLARLLKAAQA